MCFIESYLKFLIHVHVYLFSWKYTSQEIPENTVKPVHVVTSIKQSPVVKGHLFSCPVIEICIWIESILRGHFSYKATFSLSQRWSLTTGLTVNIPLVQIQYVKYAALHKHLTDLDLIWPHCNKTFEHEIVLILEKQPANQNAVSNKYFVLIGQYQNRSTIIVLPKFYDHKPRWSLSFF